MAYLSLTGGSAAFKAITALLKGVKRLQEPEPHIAAEHPDARRKVFGQAA